MSVLYRSRRFALSFLRLTRVWNLLIIALSQYVTAAMLIGWHTVYDYRLFILCLSTLSIAAAGYIINDYYDIKIDLVNKPERVVIGKGITRRYALLYHTVFSIAGVFLGLFVNWRVGAINFCSAFLLWWYSNDLKRQPFIGNLVVAALTGIAVVMIDVIYKTGSLLIITYATFAFFMTLVREIIKDIEDLKGDNTFGCKTLPIIWGVRKTKLFIYGILLLFSLVVIFLNIYLPQLPQYYFLALLFPPLLLLVFRLSRADTKKDFGWLSSFCKVIMLLGLISLVFI